VAKECQSAGTSHQEENHRVIGVEEVDSEPAWQRKTGSGGNGVCMATMRAHGGLGWVWRVRACRPGTTVMLR
jgi:hypothetical protein